MIKYLIMDVDGTLTDGKIYMGSDGEVMKAFSVKDGYVINFILKPLGIIPIIVTARTSTIVKNRCDELGITEVYQGSMDKLDVIKEIVGADNIGICSYFGDDILDLKCMTIIKEAGGLVGCPADAVREIKAIADYVCVSRAGEGALREFSELIVKERVDESIIDKRVQNALAYLQGLNISKVDIGKKIVVNEYFFYSVQSYTTKIEDECKLKSHRKYIDIQIMVFGSEAIDLTDISRLSIEKAYDEENDVMFWKIPKRLARITLRPKDYIILYPENAHRTAVSAKENENVIKIVGKIKITS